MDGAELARWTRFAGKGGIGQCTATEDCVAENAEDLMFLKDDEITVLMQLPNLEDTYLGYCEGVVGRFLGAHVRFHAKLKKPIMAKRSSMASVQSPTPTVVLEKRESKDVLVRSPSLLTGIETSLEGYRKTLDEMPDRLRFAVRSPSPEIENDFASNARIPEKLRVAVRSPSPEEDGTMDLHLARNPGPRHQSTDDTLRNDSIPVEKISNEDEDSKYHARHQSTDDTIVVVLPPIDNGRVDVETRSPSPIMQRIRDELKDDDIASEISAEGVLGEDSIVVSPSEDVGDAGISIGLSMLEGSDDESQYSDDDSNASRTVEAFAHLNAAALELEEPAKSSEPAPTESAPLQSAPIPVDPTLSSPTSPGSDNQSESSEPRKSTDTYDPWGDIYDDYRYSVATNGTKSSASVYSSRSTHHQPFPSPLLHTRFGSQSSESLELPKTAELSPEPSTPPLTIRKRSTPVAEGERQSLFLPHPGAPKAPPPPSPLPTDVQTTQPQHTPTGGNLLNTIHQALSSRRPRPTIYGKILGELWEATGPIGITFSIDPPPLPPPPSIFAPRTSSPLRATTSSPSAAFSGAASRVRPRSRSFSDLRMGHVMQTQSVKENTPTITSSRSMSQLNANDPVPTEAHRVSRVHVPEPIKVVAPQRFGSFIPGSGQRSPSAPQSPRMRSNSNSPALGNGPLPMPSGLASAPVSAPSSPSASSPPRLQRETPVRRDSSPMASVANTLTMSNASKSLSLLTQVPESRMSPPPPPTSPPPPNSPPPTMRMTSPPPSAKSPSPPPATLARQDSAENSPSLAAMAQSLSSPLSSPNFGVLNQGSNIGRESPSLGSAARVLSPPPKTAGPSHSPNITNNTAVAPPASLTLGRDSPVLGTLQGHPASSPPLTIRSPPASDRRVVDGNDQPFLQPPPVEQKRSLTLSPPPVMTSLQVETPSPSPASLSAFPLPPFTTSNGLYSPSSSAFPFPPPASAPGPSRSTGLTPPPSISSLADSPNRKLSLPNLRTRALSHRTAESNGSSQMRPSLDTESVRSGFSSSGVSVSVRSMEFEMLTGQGKGGGSGSPSSPVPRSSTTSFSSLPSPLLPPSFPAAASSQSRDQTPVPQLREREAKFLSTLSTTGGNKAKKKKFKKLIQESHAGVPMSVRWLVWMELVATSTTPLPPPGPSSGAVGGGLGGGGPGGRNAEALRALLDAVEGAGSNRLKQAYRRMFPDVGWGDELDALLPFLLTLAPEQDAFWIFICVMDTYLRGYYTRAGDESAPQLEIDAELLARSLSKADPTLAHHLLTRLGIPAGKIARSIGLRGAFVGRILDPDETQEGIRRVWDSWLCDSDSLHILIRTALTLVIHAPRRQALLSTADPEDALRVLATPMNIHPDELLLRNAKWKVGDDEVKRERGRMAKVLAEAARKKGSGGMTRGAGRGGRGISLPRP